MASLFVIAPQYACAQASEPQATAIFPVELWDTSGEGVKPSQVERLKLATNKLTELLEHTGRYRSVDLSSFAARIAATEPRYNCNGCWLGIARDAGADLAVLAVVHKVSTLISRSTFMSPMSPLAPTLLTSMLSSAATTIGPMSGLSIFSSTSG